VSDRARTDDAEGLPPLPHDHQAVGDDMGHDQRTSSPDHPVIVDEIVELC
jgi:hypothetical protein